MRASISTGTYSEHPVTPAAGKMYECCCAGNHPDYGSSSEVTYYRAILGPQNPDKRRITLGCGGEGEYARVMHG